MVTDIKAWLPHNLYQIVKKPLSFHIRVSVRAGGIREESPSYKNKLLIIL